MISVVKTAIICGTIIICLWIMIRGGKDGRQ